ncbi:MAG: hypothetical protein HC836_15620 [Richelia sp. RM2_1_2]|nr:hypothetical protein [Richelia sp. RM2_1_2]
MKGVPKEYSWSLDISTTNVGMALWDEKGKLIELKHLQLKVDNSIPEENRYLYKARLFRDHIRKFKERVNVEYGCEITNIFVEKPLPNTGVNINTTAKLLGFNGIVCYILYEIFGVEPLLISVHDCRRIFCDELLVKKNGKLTLSFPKNIDKKEYIWKKVTKLEPNIKWIYDKNNKIKRESFDMSDAFACGYSSLKLLDIIHSDYKK